MPKVSPFTLALVVSAALPLVGVILAGVRYAEGLRQEATQYLIAAVLGVFVWVLIIGAVS